MATKFTASEESRLEHLFPPATTNSKPGKALFDFSSILIDAAVVVRAASFYEKASVATGGFVKVLPEYKYLPLLLDKQGEPVLLYRIVESIEQAVDLTKLREEYPQLSYGQLMGALAFLRRVAQFNADQIDIDELESEMTESDPRFYDELRRALADQERTRVLGVHQ